jgi:hypothetical protein
MAECEKRLWLSGIYIPLYEYELPQENWVSHPWKEKLLMSSDSSLTSRLHVILLSKTTQQKISNGTAYLLSENIPIRLHE